MSRLNPQTKTDVGESSIVDGEQTKGARATVCNALRATAKYGLGGALIGSLVSPPAGTAAGAGIGAAYGGLHSLAQDPDVRIWVDTYLEGDYETLQLLADPWSVFSRGGALNLVRTIALPGSDLIGSGLVDLARVLPAGGGLVRGLGRFVEDPVSRVAVWLAAVIRVSGQARSDVAEEFMTTSVRTRTSSPGRR